MATSTNRTPRAKTAPEAVEEKDVPFEQMEGSEFFQPIKTVRFSERTRIVARLAAVTDGDEENTSISTEEIMMFAAWVTDNYIIEMKRDEFEEWADSRFNDVLVLAMKFAARVGESTGSTKN